MGVLSLMGLSLTSAQAASDNVECQTRTAQLDARFSKLKDATKGEIARVRALHENVIRSYFLRKKGSPSPDAWAASAKAALAEILPDVTCSHPFQVAPIGTTQDLKRDGRAVNMNCAFPQKLPKGAPGIIELSVSFDSTSMRLAKSDPNTLAHRPPKNILSGTVEAGTGGRVIGRYPTWYRLTVATTARSYDLTGQEIESLETKSRLHTINAAGFQSFSPKAPFEMKALAVVGEVFGRKPYTETDRTDVHEDYRQVYQFDTASEETEARKTYIEQNLPDSCPSPSAAQQTPVTTGTGDSAL